MKHLSKLLLCLTISFFSAVSNSAELNIDNLYGVWNVDKMVMSNGSSIPGSGEKLEFTKDKKLKTIMGKSVITNSFRIEGDSIFVKVPIGEAEHNIKSLTKTTMLFEFPDGMVYELSKP